LVEVFFTKLVFNLKSEASKTYLSYLWWLLEPVLMVGIFYLVFAVFLHRGGPHFVVFLVCGKIPFLWFSKSVTNASRSILNGRGLINQVSIPKTFFPILVVFQDSVKQVVVFTFMFTFIILFGTGPSWVWLSVIFVVLTQFLLICAVSMLFAAITPFLPDFRYLIATLMIALMMTSGIFFNYKTVILPQHQALFLMNPLANLINNYRQVLMEHTLPDWVTLGQICLFCAGLILLMAICFRKTDNRYARLVTQ